MAEKVRPQAQPSPENLPKPTILWEGYKEAIGDAKYPCRIVHYYVWTLKAEEKDWSADPKVAFEVADQQDLLGNLKYNQKPINEAPPAAFYEMAKR